MEGEYLRLDMVSATLTDKALSESTGYLATTTEDVILTSRMSCSLRDLQEAIIEECSGDPIVQKLMAAKRLSFIPCVVRFKNGMIKNLYHTYDDVIETLDKFIGVDTEVLGYRSYNVFTKEINR